MTSGVVPGGTQDALKIVRYRKWLEWAHIRTARVSSRYQAESGLGGGAGDAKELPGELLETPIADGPGQHEAVRSDVLDR